MVRPIVDSASGVSGAGRSPVVKSLFCEVSLQAYNVFKHRHAPEIEAYCGTRVIFTPHLAAFDRGILSTIHVELAEGWDAAAVARVFQDAYGNEPFVRLCAPGTFPAVADVRHSNFCDIGWMVEPGGRHLIIESAVDNLVKGAAGQAVQCMNCRLGLDEREGLLRGAY
jgi:N-acetyl-gamma-glutamyl-phosphate reductase